MNSKSWGLGLPWDVLLKEFPVTGGHPARAVNTHNILVKLADLEYHACLVPFSGVWSGLVLDLYIVANC